METIRAFYERWDRGDVPGFSELLAEDAEFVSPPGAIDPGGRRGPGGFVAVRRAVGNRFGSFSHEIRGLRDAQERVLASVVFRAEKSEGGGPTVQTEFHVWTLRDGGIVQLACTNFWTGFSDSHDEVHQSHDRPRVGRPRVVELVQPGRDSRARSAACSVYESDSAGPPADRRELDDRQTPRGRTVGAGVAPAFMPKRHSELSGNRRRRLDNAVRPEIGYLWAPGLGAARVAL
ncbi:MAG: nuclear transport factor 2 family protein [Solirubrobacteraceae bacterium]